MNISKLEQAEHDEPLEQLGGRLVYDYEGVKLFAPAPAVKLDRIEKTQWRSD